MAKCESKKTDCSTPVEFTVSIQTEGGNTKVGDYCGRHAEAQALKLARAGLTVVLSPFKGE